MPLEGTTTIDGLNTSWPLNGDGVNEGDDHLRQEKIVLKTMLPGITGNGLSIPVTATEVEMNYLIGVSSAIQTQLDAITASITANALGIIPIGAIITYNGLFASIPTNYQLCDGTNGTPDMTNQFAYGTNTEGELNSAGGSADSIVVQHNHIFTGNAMSNHQHSITFGNQGQVSGLSVGDGSSLGSRNTAGASAGTPSGGISNTGTSATDANIPPYIKLAYIRRMT